MRQIITYLIIAIVVLSGCCVLSSRSGAEEGFSNAVAREAGLYKTDLTDVDMKAPRRYVDMNAQQMIYRDLVSAMDKISGGSHKVSGKGTTELYKPETMTIEVKDELDEITDQVLARFNQVSGYSFRKYGYDNVKQELGGDGSSVRYIYDVFIQDPIESFEIRVQIDVVKVFGKAPDYITDGGMETCASKTTPEFKTYPIGYPQTRQMVPLPTQVIPTGNQVIGVLGVNVRDPLPIKDLLLNYMRIYNANNILHADTFCDKSKKIGGIYDGTVDSSFYSQKQEDGGCSRRSEVRNKWIPVPQEVGINPDYPVCSPDDFRWTKDGIMEKPPGTCQGIRNPMVQQPFIAEYNPTVTGLPRFGDPNNWLFDRARGNPQNRSGV